ncbi:hypothetical protein R8510_01104 [Ralstonia chuxiongensis]|nr:hypothetical protein R8510_01104 [Ralstonia chuxiongensis]
MEFRGSSMELRTPNVELKAPNAELRNRHAGLSGPVCHFVFKAVLKITRPDGSIRKASTRAHPNTRTLKNPHRLAICVDAPSHAAIRLRH